MYRVIKCFFISVIIQACNPAAFQDSVTVNPITNENGDHSTVSDCNTQFELDFSRGSCNEWLRVENNTTISQNADHLIIQSNSIPNHRVGKFGGGSGSLNPNAIQAQNNTYYIPRRPLKNHNPTYLLSTTSGPLYRFGVLLNGIELDPEAAEPWPHTRPISLNANWEWNLDAMNINLGLDCNNAHVQPSGKYHYHGSPTLYLESLSIPGNQMTLLGYAADGFPIYYKYGLISNNVQELKSSYRLKSGQRPGNGITAPCGEYNGSYTRDYEFVEGLGDLDECNGRFGVTPEYPDGTYYYAITEAFPYIGRCLYGSISTSFKLRG